MTNANLLIVGSIGLDTLSTPFGRVERVLGGTAVYASCSASHYTQAAIVGVVGTDFPQEHEDFLLSKKVDLTCLEKVEGKTFFWQGRYEGDMNAAITEDTQLGVFADFAPKVSEAHKPLPFLFLGNIHPQLQLDVLDAMTDTPVVAADTMNFWIDGTPDLLKQVISRVDIMLVNDAEAQAVTGKTHLLDAADAIRAMGPKVVVIKKGSHGAMLFFDEGIFSVPAIPLRTAKDPTGAGDTFAGGMMGYIARQGNIEPATLKQAAVVGTVMASFTVEDFSLNRLGTVQKPEIAERICQLRQLSAFDELSL
jgi:sugar/nucleoside kinase (ribokinase family)